MSAYQKIRISFLMGCVLLSTQGVAIAGESLHQSGYSRHLAQHAAGRSSSSQPSADDLRRFEFEKLRREGQEQIRRENTIKLYASSIKAALEKAWGVPLHKGLFVTKRMIILNEERMITKKEVVSDSSLKREIESVDSVLQSFKFPAPPADFDTLELSLSFQSDGSRNEVDVVIPTTLRQPISTSRASVDFSSYLLELRRKIKKAWSPPHGFEEKRVYVVFQIQTKGELSQLRLVRSSGAVLPDQAAFNAVERAAPFGPLPKGSPPYIIVEFAFDSKSLQVSSNRTFDAL